MSPTDAIIQIPKIKPQDNRLNWGGFIGCSSGLAISRLAEQSDRPVLVITPDLQYAERLSHEIQFFNDKVLPIEIFRDWETLPYDHFSPHQDIVSERLDLLAKLPMQKNGIVLGSITTLMHRLLPKEYLLANSLLIKIKDRIDLSALTQRLIEVGYRHVGQVMEHGEFTIRGSIIDIFPMGNNIPFRIELFDDEVESIRSFSPEDQRSIKKIEKIDLLPAREFPLSEDGIARFRQNWRAKFSGNPTDAPLYHQISQGEAANGIEYYLSLFYESTSTFFDYLPKNTLIVLVNDITRQAEQFWEETKHRYEQLKYDITRPLCPPAEVFLPPDNVFAQIKPFTQIKMSEKDNGDLHYRFNAQHAPDLALNHRILEPLSKLRHYVLEYRRTPGNRILFAVESTGRRETLLDLLATINVKPTNYKSWHDFLNADETIGIVVSPLEQGIELIDLGISVISEAQLFGEQVKQRQYRKQRQLDPNLMIRNLTELSIGAPVVHLNHGVGRYLGLQTIQTGEIEAEYLTLEYADNDKIYVPVSSLHLISRYTGVDSDRAPLQKLGSKSWEKIKRKTAEQIRDVAAELLDVYGRRHAAKGFAFKIEQKDYETFRSGFPFTETEDQARTIQDVIKDMTTDRCMDRLVCGDVGFGKTEVAMRAAFIATQNNKQVVILVPTTLLANQHLQNFQDRFSEWPIKIVGLSRLQSASQQAQVLKGLEDGTVDIVIGTHKLLSEDIKYKNLGLLVIDEEHRFGVRQKERITALRAHIDILTLTATPIPRTLNMALAGTRDLSIIATPPPRRLSVKTFIHEYNEPIVREAILRETMRGGQIYYLHNDVATIEPQAEKLRTIAPQARIAVAHGQMRERELERIMAEFYHQHYNVLVCSTIVESGIDVPTANTIIINRADRFGLAQLHQLRGRVGRSHHQAYAYLLTPHPKSITKDAVKRLDAIAELGDLGIGFSLSTYDLEIRGAGELLGEEQSGHIHAIGFTLYMELLEEAVNALKSGREPSFEKPLNAGAEIELGIPALLPKEYIGDVNVRLTLYKRLANCQNQDEIQEFKAEMIDRFGMLPPAAQNLFQLANIRLIAQNLGIAKIETGTQFGYFYFDAKTKINPEHLIKLIQTNPKNYQFQGSDRLRYKVGDQSAEGKINEVLGILSALKT